MATRNGVITRPSPGDTILVTAWPIANGDDGSPAYQGDWADRTVHVYGTGTFGTVTLQGRNDPAAAWQTLTDQAGNNLTFTAEGLRLVLQAPLYIRPLHSGGDGTTSLNVVMVSRRLSPRVQ